MHGTYLEAFTKEKFYIVPFPEFEDLEEGNILVIHKVLYGLKSLGLRWGQRIDDIMLQMVFCLLEPTHMSRSENLNVELIMSMLVSMWTCASEFVQAQRRASI